MLLRKFTVKDIVQKLDDYTARHRDDLPILEECCLESGWDFDELDRVCSTNDRIRHAVGRLLCRKRVNLERSGALGTFNKQMAVYILERLDNRTNDSEIQSSLRMLDKLLRYDTFAADRLDDNDLL